MVSKEKIIRGTREWAVANIDCCTGCSHDCRYCYARYNSVKRDKEVDAESWRTPRIRKEDVEAIQPCYGGTVMFPTAHDILPEILDDCIIVIENLVKAGNRILIVTKPHLHCVRKICDTFRESKDQLLFRFTITAKDNDILKFWEPNAPSFEERFTSLKYAYEKKFETSVSVEPMLDADNIGELVSSLAPYVTHSIWLGKMNKIAERVDCDTVEMQNEVDRIEASQRDEKIKTIYQQLKGNSLIRWKESIKLVVGLEPAKEPGLDM